MNISKNDIEKLRRETLRDYALCEKALKKNRGDYKKAREYVLQQEEAPKSKIGDHVASVLLGEKSFRFSVYRNSEEIFNIPVLFLIVTCLLIPMSAAFIGLCLFFTVLFNCSVYIESSQGHVKERLKTVKANKDKEETVITPKEPMDGGEEIIIKEEGKFLNKEADGTCQLIIQ